MYRAGHSGGLASALIWTGVTVALAQTLPRVSGEMTTDDGRQLVSAALSMRPVRAEAAADTPLQEAVIGPDGSFTFRSVPPGEYVIRARGDVDPHGPSLFGTFRVRVDSRDVEHVLVTLVPGGQIDGRVVVESGGAIDVSEALRGLRVRAPLTDDPTFGDALSGDVGPDGRYSIRGVMAGSHTIAVDGLREPWVVKGVSWRGRDITTAGLQVESRQVYSDVRVTIATRSSVATSAVSR